MHFLNFPVFKPFSRQKNIIAIKYKFMQEKNKKNFFDGKNCKKARFSAFLAVFTLFYK